MIRTTIYLTDKGLDALNVLTKETGLSQSELVRQAIDHFCMLHRPQNKINLMRKAKGIWEDRDDISGIQNSRNSFDRDIRVC